MIFLSLWTTCCSDKDRVLDDWFGNHRYNNRYFQLSPFIFLQLDTHNLKQGYNCGCHQTMAFFFLSLCHIISTQMSNLSVMRSGASARSGPISLTTLLLAVSWARGKWICLLFRRPGLFSPINLINILIMNLDDSAIRLSGFQTWPLW